MKRLLKIIISLLVTAAMFAIVHLVLQLNVFHFSSPNRFVAYLPDRRDDGGILRAH